MRLPRLVKIEQELYSNPIADVEAAVSRQLDKIMLKKSIRPKMSIAVTAGSRGIAAMPTVLKSVVDYVKACGAKPFIFPAMGSHGQATAAGQRGLLATFGITEKTVGAPIRSDMKVVQVGTTHKGHPIYLDALAAKADGIIVVNRIKEHTDFAGSYESGLLKMITIGMGKRAGALATHQQGLHGMSALIEQVGCAAIDKLPIMCGIALLEDGYHQLSQIEALKPENIPAAEKRLLKKVKRNAPRLPLKYADILVIDRCGKDISGVGMDPNITGRFWEDIKRSQRQFRCRILIVLGLTKATKGNANGIGYADLITKRVMRAFDAKATYANVLTSGNYSGAKMPIVCGNDREAIETAMTTGLHKATEDIKLIRIKDTLSLAEFYISEALLEETSRNPKLSIKGKARPMKFDARGNLLTE